MFPRSLVIIATKKASMLRNLPSQKTNASLENFYISDYKLEGLVVYILYLVSILILRKLAN